MNSSSSIKSMVVATAVASLAFCLFVPGVARADGEDAPSGNVARIGLADGNVAVQRGDGNTTTAAAANAPVLPGDYITTGQPGRAEIQLDGRSVVRIGENAQVRFAALDPEGRTMQLAAGTVAVRLYAGSPVAVAIDTPSVTVRPRESGLYRVTVTPDGKTEVTVRNGQTAVETPSGAQVIGPGTTLLADGPASGPSITTTTAVAFDDFDRFDADRDHADVPPPNVAYSNPNIDGLADVDANGHWVADPANGQVWVPNGETADWAPYRDGRWAWENDYGWTWVAAEPWGWAPYHYGSWYHSPAYGWGWVPPPAIAYAPWRPAMVAFLSFGGGGTGFSVGLNLGGVGIGFSNIGWVPLAPGEAYHPWWGPHWGTNVTNITNITNVTNINVYRNASYPGAVTGMPSERFLQGNFAHNVAVAPSQLRQAQVFRGAVPVVPSARNLQYSDRAVPAQLSTHNAFTNRTFAGGTVAVTRTPFQQERSAMTAYVQHPPAARTAPAATTIQSQRPVENQTSGYAGNSAWRQFSTQRGTAGSASSSAATQPYHASPTAVEERGAPQSRPAWTAFGNARPSYASPSNDTPRTTDAARNPAAGAGYQRPATSGAQPYSRPVTPAQQQYSRPAPVQQQYTRPAAPYQPAPGANYSAPRAAMPTYAAPRNGATYHAPAPVSPRTSNEDRRTPPAH